MEGSRLQIGHLLFRVSRRLRWEIDEVLAASGLTTVQFLVLHYLSKHEGRERQRHLRDHLRVEAPSLTGLLQRMERDSLIQRNREVLDRRNQEILITERGQELYAQLSALVESHSEAIFARLPETEVSGLLAGLSALGQVLGLEAVDEGLDRKEKPDPNRKGTGRARGSTVGTTGGEPRG